jgi:glycosyltransferase involved in cell wall biosynthesis
VTPVTAVSFVIPAYNAAETVAESIESALQAAAAAGTTAEIVVLDDGSTDGTREMVEPYRASCDLKILAHRENRGGAASRNTAIEAARYDPIFMLDSDNLLDAESFASLIARAAETDWQILAFSEIRHFQHQPENVTHSWVFEREVLLLADVLRMHEHPVASGNYLLRREAWHRVGGYPEFAGSLDAWGFGFRALLHGASFRVHTNSFYLHRQGHDSFWIRDTDQARTIAAAQLLVPAIPLLCAEDQRYLLADRGLFGWLDNLHQRPLRLAVDVARATPACGKPADADQKSSRWTRARAAWTELPPSETARRARRRLRDALQRGRPR